jgi:nucleoside-diphosphate kinase
MIKPDGVSRKLIGKVLARFEEEGLELAAIKQLTPSSELLVNHYTSLQSKPFFKGLIAHMSAGQVIATVRFCCN